MPPSADAHARKTPEKIAENPLPSVAPTGRIPELDAVRGLAAVAIVLFHWRFHWPFLRTAVDLFFVLSGFLITSILLRTGESPHAFRTFYARRALRIFPIYYLTFAIFLAINPFAPRPHPIAALPYFLTYTQFIQGYWGQTIPPFSRAFGHTWTLAIEEQFYLFWPLVAWAVGRRPCSTSGAWRSRSSSTWQPACSPSRWRRVRRVRRGRSGSWPRRSRCARSLPHSSST